MKLSSQGRIGLVLILLVGMTGGCMVEDYETLVAGIQVGQYPPYIIDGQFKPATAELLYSPSMFGVDYEDLVFESAQGLPVHAWYLPTENPAGTVLIHHGSLTNRSAVFGNYIILWEMGFNVLVYDYQGYGENENTPGLHTVLYDARTVLDYLRECDRPGTDRIILYGLSMGTLPTIQQAATTPDDIVGVILEGSFTMESLPNSSYLLVGMLPWAVDIMDLYPELDPAQYIDDISVPKLFIQSRNDTITPYEGAEQLYELAVEPKQLVEVRGAHTAAWISDWHYEDILTDFLESLPESAGE